MTRDDSFSGQFLAFVDVVSRLYPVMLEKTGLTRLRWVILKLTIEQAPLTMSELTRALELPKSNLTYHVDWLEEAGFLLRAQSAEDRRVTFLSVTPAGRAVVAQVPDDLERRLERLSAEIPAEEVAAMRAGLALLVARGDLLFDA